jgi:predicted permease
LKPADFRTALAPFAARLVAFSALISVFIWLCQYYRVDLVTENQPTLYLLGFLPPAANIIVLETHYMKSGRSASMIACGTCLSIIAIGLYAAAVIAMRA